MGSVPGAPLEKSRLFFGCRRLGRKFISSSPGYGKNGERLWENPLNDAARCERSGPLPMGPPIGSPQESGCERGPCCPTAAPGHRVPPGRAPPPPQKAPGPGSGEESWSEPWTGKRTGNSPPPNGHQPAFRLGFSMAPPAKRHWEKKLAPSPRSGSLAANSGC